MHVDNTKQDDLDLGVIVVMAKTLVVVGPVIQAHEEP